MIGGLDDHLHFKRQLSGWSSQLDGFRPLPTTGFNLEGVTRVGD